MDTDERPTRVDLSAPLSASAVSNQAVPTNGERCWYGRVSTCVLTCPDLMIRAAIDSLGLTFF